MNDVPDDILATAKASVDLWLASDHSIDVFVANLIMAERERCAKIADGYPAFVDGNDIAARIRRGTA